MVINWNDPVARLHLAEAIGEKEYNKALTAHIKESTVETVNGHGIRPVSSRFGKLWLVGDTGKAFNTLEKAKGYAEGLLPVLKENLVNR